MIKFFVSGFVYPGITWTGLLLGIGLGIAFGAIWLAGYWPPLRQKPWLWAVLAVSPVLSWLAVAFGQIPLQALTGQALGQFWSQETLISWLWLAGIPQTLLSGLVQEGSKLVPIVIWWRLVKKELTPRTGLLIGAMAGAGLGIFEAVWAHNNVFAAGWTWQVVEARGIIALVPFWERFFTVALHIGLSALTGYGLAKGWGWQFYLLAAFLHSLANYSAVLLQSGVFTIFHVEIYAAVIAVLLTAVMLTIRWRGSEDTID